MSVHSMGARALCTRLTVAGVEGVVLQARQKFLDAPGLKWTGGGGGDQVNLWAIGCVDQTIVVLIFVFNFHLEYRPWGETRDRA